MFHHGVQLSDPWCEAHRAQPNRNLLLESLRLSDEGLQQGFGPCSILQLWIKNKIIIRSLPQKKNRTESKGRTVKFRGMVPQGLLLEPG